MANKRTNLVLMFSLTILFMGPYRIPISLSHLIPYFLALFLLVFSETKRLRIFDRRSLVFLISYFLSIAFMLVYSIGIDVSLTSILGILDNLIRPVLLFIIGIVASKTWGLRGALLIVIFLSAILALVQFIFPAIAKDFLVSWYDEPRKVFHVLASKRAIGTFALPADFGFFSLLGIVFCINEYYSNKADTPKGLILGFVASIICGVLSSSKTFYLGLIALLIISIVIRTKKETVERSTRESPFRKKIQVILAFVSTSFLFLSLYQNNEEFKRSLDIFRNKMEDPVYAVVGGRYNYALVDMQNEIITSFPNGNGLQTGISSSGSFIGDSGFLVVLFRGGLFGFLLYYFSILTIFTKNRILLLIFFTAILVELGRPAFMASRAADMLWLLVGSYYSRSA